MARDFSPQKDLPPEQEPEFFELDESDSLAAFDQWMDDQLASLVARWVHTAAPAADIENRISRRARLHSQK